METQQKTSKVKFAVVILATLLVISIVSLICLLLNSRIANRAPATVSIPDNIVVPVGEVGEKAAQPGIGEAFANAAAQKAAAGSDETGTAPVQTKAQMLELEKNHHADNTPFSAENLFPGDSITKYFAVKTHHDDDVTLLFRPDVTDKSNGLENVLHIKVTNLESGAVLCDDMFVQADGREFSEVLAANANKESTAYYAVTVSLDTSVGSEYEAAGLQADFHWYAGEDEPLTDAPQTGESAITLLWIVSAVLSLALILLILYKRKKGGGAFEQ